MFSLDIPGFGPVRAKHLVLDYNGTLAEDGRLVEGVAQRLHQLADCLSIHVITADTFGSVQEALMGLPLDIATLGPGNQEAAKRAFMEDLGAEHVIAMGNGRNDAAMLKAARIGMAILMKEGSCAQTLMQADLVSRHICEALDLLLHPLRLVATLRH
jgi:soluble P-type ATPase